MNYKLSFGKYEDKTFEWLFFKAPWYADWIFQEQIYRQAHCFDEEEALHFRELHKRATSLTGICSVCKKQQVQRMGLTTHFKSGNLGAVGFYCNDCEYQGGSPTSYHHPSFFVEEYNLPRSEQRIIVSAIKSRYIGDGSLTQKKMEAFFKNDANFNELIPGFFTRIDGTMNGEEKKAA